MSNLTCGCTGRQRTPCLWASEALGETRYSSVATISDKIVYWIISNKVTYWIISNKAGIE